MDTQDISLLQSGQQVGLAVADYPKEFANFPPLQAAETERAALVTAIEARQTTQDNTTAASTSVKDEAREAMARATKILSAKAVRSC